MKDGKGRFTYDGVLSGRIYIPSHLVMDSTFPLQKGKVDIKIFTDSNTHKQHLIISQKGSDIEI